MREGRITVAVLEPNDETRHELFALLSTSEHLWTRVFREIAAYYELYGTADGPDILLVGLDTQPHDAIAAIKRIVTSTPACGVLVYGQEPSPDLLRQAMAAGARRCLPYPFDATALEAAIHEVHEEVALLAATCRPFAAVTAASPSVDGQSAGASKVITLFSPKGGVGTTTVAVNLACALRALGSRVALVDGNISFGNVGLFLDLQPSMSMLHLLDGVDRVHEASLDEALLPHESGLRVLLAPPMPEDGEKITSAHLRTIIALLRARYDYIVVDTWPSYDERVLTMLEAADHIVAPTGPDLPSIKNLEAFLRVAQLLGYPDEKVLPVLMRADSVPESHVVGLEGFLGRPLGCRIVSDGKRVMESVNNGAPFVRTAPHAPVSQSIIGLARRLDGQEVIESVPTQRQRPFWNRGLFGLSAAH